MNIGIAGTGRMGSAIAARLIGLGHGLRDGMRRAGAGPQRR
jgi:3-hydroxyisobutyrate dehydrogenase-like beta-hydroxyacid dehydrogenase